MNSKNCLRALACAGAVLGGFSASADIPASAYVQRGLVAQWDGIENAGRGQPHNPDAAYPQELISGIGQTLTGQQKKTWIVLPSSSTSSWRSFASQSPSFGSKTTSQPSRWARRSM